MTTKQYLRFVPTYVFGVIGSSTARILQLSCYNKKNNTVAVPACENVILWNLQTKQQSLVLKGEASCTSYVTCLISDSSCKNIVVGYGDGKIRVFDSKSGNCTVSFCGHRSAVSCLSYDEDNSNLASGGKDSEIVVWDVVLEAGLFRFKGHKGPITKCHFLEGRNILISSSKDTYIKLWDLATQHCFQTLVGNRYEILDFTILKGTRLITGLNDVELKVWDLLPKDGKLVNENMKRLKLSASENEVMAVETEQIHKDPFDNDDSDEIFECVQIGKLKSAGHKTVSIVVDERERLLGFHASTKILQLYKIFNLEEISKRLRKRKRKEDKKREKGEDLEDHSLSSEITASLDDELQILPAIQTNAKIDSFSITVDHNDTAKIAVLLKNNSIFQYEFDFRRNDSVAKVCHQLLFPGHRSMVNSLNYSKDSLSVFSVSFESVRIWKSFEDQEHCSQAFDCNSALSSVFISDNNHCIIGTKNGELQIFETNSQELLENVEAHVGAVNCLCESPDKYGVTSGSKDKNIKFWSYELVHDENFSQIRKRLSLSLKRTLQMPGEIVCLRYSPDKSKIAVSLEDNTVQVLFVDSLKLAFSLYGHILPVTCMDISYDSTLIATGSEDKDIRIWSMEFGSCLKFIEHAHDKGLTCLRFLPKTHLFFTGGKDYAVKQWDADNFQKITTLKGHQNEVTAMTVSPDGVTVVTASKDKSIRKWEKTNEPLVLSEEQEKEREEEDKVEELPPIPGEVNTELAMANLKTAETIKSVDQLIDAIDIYKNEVLKRQEHENECKRTGKEHPAPTPHPLLIAYSTTCPVRYMRNALNKIKSSELEGALVLLPFNYVLEFLKILCEFADRKWETELCVRCSTFLVRIHMGQLSSQNFEPVIERLNEKLFPQIHELRDMIGFAKVACQVHLHEVEAIEEIPVFAGIVQDAQRKKKSKKKQRALVGFT